MKTKLLLANALALFFAITAIAQDFIPPVNHTDEIRYKKDEVIVKFKDDVNVKINIKNSFTTIGISSVDEVLENAEAIEMNQLFRGSKKEVNRKINHFPDGIKKPVPQLFNIYLVKTLGKKAVMEIVSELNTLDEVEYAEVNGEAYIGKLHPVGKPFKMTGLPAIAPPSGRTIPTPDDPLYPDQWYIPEVKADSLWETTTGDTLQVISILDTGVDYDHPDLINKIWINNNEIPDNGIDDDNNGYIDDVRGWDFVNQDNQPKDDNSHGTHCAGIAAAETDNGIGIAGVSWGAKIMPIKVFQSNGIGYFSHIAQGFWYAAQNGSTLYSNSWSSGGESLTIRNAMEYAYAFGLIVAAAGNMNYKTDLPFPPWPPYQPNYPACYNWVLGVEATQPGGNNAWFSNFDPTGPIISDSRPYGGMYYNDYDYNYEMRAPGVSFMSTVPNGQYRSYNGTSMACPLVAGSIALMKSYDPNLSNEQVFAKLIQPMKLSLFQAGVMDIQKSTFTDPPAELYYVSNSIADSLFGGDNDGKPDAGETINMYVSVKNAGGLGDSIFAKLRFSEFEDTTTAQILDSTCYLGSISAYATNTSFDPIKIKIDSNVVHYRIISFELLIWEQGAIDTVYKGLTLTIEHGIEIKGTYEKLHLTGDAYYLVSDAAVIDSLIIDPGVTITFNPNMFIATPNYVHAVGTPDSMITFTGVTEGFYWNGIIQGEFTKSIYEYCKFEYANSVFPYDSHNDTMRHCIFNYCKNRVIAYGYGGEHRGLFEKNVIINHQGHPIYWWGNAGRNKNGIIINNLICENPTTYSGGWYALVVNDFNSLGPNDTLQLVYNNVFINNATYNLITDQGLAWIHFRQNYFGTTNLEEIHETIFDFYENSQLSIAVLDSILISPPSNCHGVVWKVELNGQNPQEVQIDPIGAGPLKFDVYFNRPMDTAYTPFVTFGIRYPYTQNIVIDSASWSSDSTIWTAYHNIDLSSGDGENTVRVAYARDTDHFEIPIERSRFHFVIQAAGSQSVAFMATPGIGKVDLEWPFYDSLNILGYNLYRYKIYNDTTFTDTIMVNNELIYDSTYTDHNVLPDTTYYYMFTSVGTDFSESDYSKVVAATPFEAANGDANGDMSVNVLDITTIVSYMLNQNPQPFLFDAADVNGDDQINVLDIIGAVQIIMGTKSAPLSQLVNVNPDPAFIKLGDKFLQLESKGQVAAMQFNLSCEHPEQIKLLCKIPGFEMATGVTGEHTITGIMYNFTQKTIPGGLLDLIKIESEQNQGITIAEVTGGDLNGDYVPILKEGEEIKLPETFNLTAQPNPYSSETQIKFDLPKAAWVQAEIFDISGRKINTLINSTMIPGSHTINWNSRDYQGRLLPSGIYFLHFEAVSENESIVKDIKLVYMR